MSALGVGGATTFSQPSNHATSLNHCHRDTTAYQPAAQTKVKCGYCGVWVRKGGVCSLCRTPQGGSTEVVVSPPHASPPTRRASVSRRRTSSEGRLRRGTSMSTSGTSLHASPGYRAHASPTRRGYSGAAAADPLTGSRRSLSRSHLTPREDYDHLTSSISQSPQRSYGHRTALNHKHRDEVPYDPSRQTKIKCSSCGCWAPKCGRCVLCGKMQGF
eukprot:TRINITY_DN11774_c0_g1_i1.p1 TRINITY_DN11774_c0_g1~~TRINITY_DN11774_c0_g1_i1.p1  ORF type:complete len:239 (+),score=61.67 TRINITY_DN11774_c0_g1_i1:72-719(+)